MLGADWVPVYDCSESEPAARGNGAPEGGWDLRLQVRSPARVPSGARAPGACWLPRHSAKVLTSALPAGPGAAVGQIVFEAHDAEAKIKKDKHAKLILVRHETSPEDVGGMWAAQGILTSTGGMTSHAAVVARGMGCPAVVGCGELGGLEEGTLWSVDGGSGLVFAGALELSEPSVYLT